MTTRRYRFVEDGLMIGRPETEEVVDLTRKSVKLWNRVEDVVPQPVGVERYADVVARSGELFLPEFCDLLQKSDGKHCARCSHVGSDSLKTIRQFGGVRLCDECKRMWKSHMRSLTKRFVAAFPELEKIFLANEKLREN